METHSHLPVFWVGDDKTSSDDCRCETSSNSLKRFKLPDSALCQRLNSRRHKVVSRSDEDSLRKFSQSEHFSPKFDDAYNMAIYRREKLLRKQQKVCNEHVERSKYVARKREQQRWEEQVELEKYIQLKIEDARVRREEYLEFKRHKANTKHVTKKCNRIKLIKRIQLWWKKVRVVCRRIERLVEPETKEHDHIGQSCIEWLEVILKGVEEVHQGEEERFETVAQHLCKPEVLNSGRMLLQRVCLPPKTKHLTNAQVRGFLSSLMINRFPDVVLGENSSKQHNTPSMELRSRLISSSYYLEYKLRMLFSLLQTYVQQRESVEHVAKSVCRHKLNSCILLFREARVVFIEAFQAWKEYDKVCITQDLLNMYKLVYIEYISTCFEARKTLSALQGTATSKEQNTQNALFLSSEEKEELDVGMQQFLCGQENQLLSLKSKAKDILNPKEYKSWLDQLTIFEGNTIHSLQQQSSTVSPKISSGPTSENSSSSNRGFGGSSLPSLQHVNSNVTTSKPKPVTDSSFQKTLSNIRNFGKNDEVVYELLINPDYKVKSFALPGLETASSKEDVVAVLYDDASKLVEDMLKRKKYETFVAIIEDIRDRIGRLTPNRKDLIDEMAEVIDVSFIQQKISSSAYTVEDTVSLISFFAEKVIALQSPARNTQTRSVLSYLQVLSGDNKLTWEYLVVIGLNFILSEVALIEIDLANFQLELLRKYVTSENFGETETEGVRYIRNRFLDLLDKKQIPIAVINGKKLPVSLINLMKKYKYRSTAEASSRAFVSEELTDVVIRRTYSDTLRCLFVGLLSSTYEVGNDTESMAVRLPETITLYDLQRSVEINQSVRQLCIVVSLEIYFCQIVGNSVRKEQRKQFRECIFKLLKDGVEHSIIQEKCVELIRNSIGSNDGVQSKTLENILSDVVNGSVYTTTLRRLSKVTRQCLERSDARQDVFDSLKDDQWLKKTVFSVWKAEVKEVVEKVLKLYLVNKQVFGSLYNDVFNAC